MEGTPPALRVAEQMPSQEAMRLLGSVSLGRVCFTMHALPAIRPVNHAVIDGRVVIRTHEGAAIVGAIDGKAVVAYEADDLDPDTHLGWSVIVIGIAHLVKDPVQLARYRAVTRPWVSGTKDYVVQIDAQVVTGIRLVEGADAGRHTFPASPTAQGKEQV